jgi:hypothetical protein
LSLDYLRAQSRRFMAALVDGPAQRNVTADDSLGDA